MKAMTGNDCFSSELVVRLVNIYSVKGGAITVTVRLFQVWYDNTGYMSSVAYMNGVHNMLLRANSMENDNELGNIGISVTNHPMNRTAKQMASYTL